MKYQLSQRFVFDAAHTLQREYEAEGSRRIHGHSYEAEVTVEGVPDAKSGMIVDLAVFRGVLNKIRDQLDHHFLDEVPGLGPATLENLCKFILDQAQVPACKTLSVTIRRAAGGDACHLIND